MPAKSVLASKATSCAFDQAERERGYSFLPENVGLWLFGRLLIDATNEYIGESHPHTTT
jgi:hypothetical protein